MKPDELFEMLGDIDDKFVDSALPVESDNVVKPQEIRLVKRKFPWGIATAACLAVCVAVGAVIVMNAGKGKIPVEPNSPAQSTPLTTIIKEAEEIYTETGGKELPLSFSIEELEEFDGLPHFQIRDDKTIIRLSKPEMNIDGWEVFSGGVTVRSVYLCDLNPSAKYDNCRELVAAVTDENGEKSVRAYDFMAQKEYELKVEDYESLKLKDGCLYLCTEDGSAVSQEPLTLQRGRFEMKPVRSDLIPEAEMIYPLVNTVELPLSFTIDEIDRKFVIRLADTVDKPVLFIKNWGESDSWYEATIFSDGVTVRHVYLCDLNDDGYREIAAAVTAENGDKFVRAYDVKNQKEYEYKTAGYESRWHYDSLTLKDGSLYLCTEDETHIDEQPLTLDNMKEVTTEDSDKVESVFDVSTVEDFILYHFIMPEYPVCEFTVDGYNIVLDQNHNITPLIGSPGISKVWLSDLNGDGKREIITECENSEEPEISFHTLMVYDLASSKRYAIENSVSYSLGQKDGVVYITYAEDDFLKPLTLDIMKENVEYRDYHVHKVCSDEMLEFTVDVDKSAYKKGEIINVSAEVTNKSDKTFYLVSPTTTTEAHMDIDTYMSIGVGGEGLIDIDAANVHTDAMNYIPIAPGESYTQKMRYDTSNANTGVYTGVSTAFISYSQNDSVDEKYAVPFYVTVY